MASGILAALSMARPTWARTPKTDADRVQQLEELARGYKTNPRSAYRIAQRVFQSPVSNFEMNTNIAATGQFLRPWMSDVADALEQAFRLNDVVFLPPGKWQLKRSVTVPDSKSLVGSGTLVLESAACGLRVGNNTRISGISFECNNNGCNAIQPDKTGNGIMVEGCTFTLLQWSIGVKLGPGAHDCAITDCRQFNGESIVSAEGADSIRVERNIALQVERPISFSGGTRNTVSQNITLGGRVGILFLSNRKLGKKNNAVSNYVFDNYVVCPSEEGISFDCHGNVPEKWPSNLVNPVVSVVSSNDSSYEIEPNAGDNGWANGYYAVNLDGADVGAYREVISSGSGWLRFDGRKSGRIAQGTKLFITTGFFLNTVADNAVFGAGTYGIGLYGACWWNKITNNVVSNCYANILVASVVSSVPISLHTFGGAAGVQSYSGANEITHNRIIIGDAPKVSVMRWMRSGGIVVYTQKFGGGTYINIPDNPKTVVRDNTIIK